MDFHPSQIPIVKVFDLKDEEDAANAAHEMVKIGFFTHKMGLKVEIKQANNPEKDKFETFSKRVFEISNSGPKY